MFGRLRTRDPVAEGKHEFVEYRQRAQERPRSVDWRQRQTERELRELQGLAKKRFAHQRHKDPAGHQSGPLDASTRKDKSAVTVQQDAVKVVCNAKGKNSVVAGPSNRNANSSMRDQVKSAVGARTSSNVKLRNGAKAKDRVDHAGPSNAGKGLHDTPPSNGGPLKVALHPNDFGDAQSLRPDASQDRPAARLPIPVRSKPTYHRVPLLDVAPRSSKDNLVYQYRARPRPPGVKLADLLVDNITDPKERWFGKNTPRTKDLLQHCAAVLVTLSFPGLGANEVILFACRPLSSNDLGRLAGRQIAARLDDFSHREDVAVPAAFRARRLSAADAETRGPVVGFFDSVSDVQIWRIAVCVVESKCGDGGDRPNGVSRDD